MAEDPDDEWTPPRLTDLSPLEREVVDAARKGTWAGHDGPKTSELAVTEDPDRCVRSELVRELLLGRHGELDPRGVRIRGVRVVGRLDLDALTAVTGLTLSRSAIPDGITCSAAKLPKLVLHGCLLSDLYGPSLHIEDRLSLPQTVVRAGGDQHALYLNGAHIGGQLNLANTAITSRNGSCLHAESLRVEGALFLRGAVVRGGGTENGALRLPDAHITGVLDLDNIKITNRKGPCLVGNGLRVEGDLFLRGAAVRGGGTEDGALNLPGAHITGTVELHEAKIVNSSGPCLVAFNLRAESDLNMYGTEMLGISDAAAVQLPGAHISGQLTLNYIKIINRSGPCLDAELLRTDGAVWLREAVVRGGGESGAVILQGARVGRGLFLGSARIIGTEGPGIRADALHAGAALDLRAAVLRGVGDHGTVGLVGAHLGGQLSGEGVRVFNGSGGPLMRLSELHVNGLLSLPATLVCPQGRAEAGRRGCEASGRRIMVRGLVFPRLGGVSWRQWLHLLVHHTPEYLPQPYQQLAAVERAAGHDGNARAVLIAQQEDLRRRAPDVLGGRLARLRHWLWGWLGRYGYRAHRLVAALAVTLAVAGGAGWAAGQVQTRDGHHAAERVQPAGTRQPGEMEPPGIPCSTAELLGLGIDRGLPLGATGLRARCDLDTATRRGQAFTFFLWGLQAVLWALVTLAVAAYTGLVRKPT